jgi:hypothetical protein
MPCLEQARNPESTTKTTESNNLLMLPLNAKEVALEETTLQSEITAKEADLIEASVNEAHLSQEILEEVEHMVDLNQIHPFRDHKVEVTSQLDIEPDRLDSKRIDNSN